MGNPKDDMIARATMILNGFDTLNFYKIAAQRAPFGAPIRDVHRLSSSFGIRSDPKDGRTRMH
ncbi:MAG: DUF5930 domain-containing protein [Paracoccaceae bacterium]